MRQNQNNISINLEKYEIPFPKEGIMLGIEIMGYLDENEELIQGSMPYCQKHMYIKETDRSEEKQTFFKNFNTAKWLSVSRFPKARSQEFYTANAMFGIEVIFEEY